MVTEGTHGTRVADPETLVERGAAGRGRADWLIASVLFLGLVMVYNANGREVGSSDSQSTKFAARELLLRGTLTLDDVVFATPEYAGRWGFVVAADGRYRSVFSPVPSLAAAAFAWPFWKAGIIDLRAPLAPGLIAKATASVLVALAATLAFLTARHRLRRGRALLLAIGLGLGTGYWSMASQTLWQTETAVFGLSLAVLAFSAREGTIGAAAAVIIGAGLGLMGSARPQLAPIALILLAGTWMRAKPRHAALASAIVAGFAAALITTNIRWFGHPFGAQALLQDVNAGLHATDAVFQLGVEGLAGLLVSPSRGLLIFSPVVLMAVPGLREALAAGWQSPVRWCALALLAQYALYGSYAVWWGGHTYGPRYMVDVLPLVVPLAICGLAPAQLGRATRAVAVAALGWSIAVSATGAFCYPHDRWNVDPASVDLHHSRLWSVTDNQIGRCWARGPSPQNFRLFDRAAFRTENP